MVQGLNTPAAHAGNVLDDVSVPIDDDQYCDYMAESKLLDRMDAGMALISKVHHATLGLMLLISSASGGYAQIQLH